MMKVARRIHKQKTRTARLSPEEIGRTFRERGLKVTPQRTAIYQALIENPVHPTADHLYTQVKRVYPMLSLNTVYRTLGVLRNAGLTHEVNYWHDRSQFDGNINPHHHLICLGCRMIQDLTDASLDRLTVSSVRRTGFEVTGHQVEFYGYCTRCRRRNPAAKRKRKEWSV
ncbi:MAG: transcriptional repressor [Nitrospiraceae bacterium]